MQLQNNTNVYTCNKTNKFTTNVIKHVLCLNKKNRHVNHGRTVKLDMDFFNDISIENFIQ